MSTKVPRSRVHAWSGDRRVLAWLQIHLCVALWGFTAILGKLISLQALPLVFWRMLLVSLVLACSPRFWRGTRHLSLRLVAMYGFIGSLVALHWWLFYAAIKLSNASVGVTCVALVPVFTAFTEPLFTKRRIERLELGLGLAVAPAVALVVGATPSGFRLGIWVGVLSAAVCSVFVALNKRYVGDTDAVTVTGIEMFAGLVFLAVLSPLLPASDPLFVLPSARDAGLLLALSLLCTLLPFTLSLVVLRELSAFAASLVVNLEPVYAIAFSIVLFNEQRELGPGFYLGVSMLLLLVLAYPWLARMRSPVAELEHDRKP